MIFLNLLRLSIRNFRNMKLRSILTVLGIGIGIGAILFLVSLGQGLQRLLIQRITTAEALLTLDVLPPGGDLVVLDDKALKKIKEMPDVAEISAVRVEKARVLFEGVTAGVAINFVENNFFRLSGLDKKLLNNAKKKDIHNKMITVFANDQSMVITKAIGALLSIENPIGKKLEVKIIEDTGGTLLDQTFTIVDIIDDGLLSSAYIPAVAFPPEKIRAYDNAKVQVKTTTKLEAVRETMVQQGFLVSALSDTVRQANRVFSVMKVILAIFGIVALIVAAIGMFNTMTIALLERTNEIGIMRSIGASSRDIWVMFLTEALIIGFLGGVSGVVIGIGIGEVANAGLNFLAARLGGQPLSIFYYPLWFVFGVILFSTIVALATGFYPARRAAHLNPLDALRYK